MKDFFNGALKQLSKLGRAMLVPVTAMPIAGLMTLIFGANMLDVPLIADAGNVVIGNMDILFAMGATVAFANGKDKVNPLVASIISFLILKSCLAELNPDISMGIFAGIIVGTLSAVVYNYSRNWKTPSIVDFFTGDKFVITLMPIITVALSVVLSFVWPTIQDGLDAFATLLGSLGALGVFIFGFLNRLLIPIGLHHVVNSYIYYTLGTFTDASGQVITGDMMRWIAGDPTAGTFLSQFYVIMIFGLPGAALAIARCARKSKRKEVEGLMFSTSLTSILTGITEPLEFSFMFVAPQLYVMHAFYTGLAGAVCYLLNCRIGFVSGTHVIDLALNWQQADNPWLIIPIGIVFFFIYFVSFTFVIKKFDLKTPGREDEMIDSIEITEEGKSYKLATNNYAYLAKKLLECLGGKDNIESAMNCMTRLRVEVKDSAPVDLERIKQLGTRGVIQLSPTSLQIIIGSEVGKVMDEFDKLI